MSRRANNSGSVYHEKRSGKWIASVSYRREDGQLRYHQRRAATAKEAQALLREMTDRQDSGLPVKDDTGTLGAYLGEWVDQVPTATTRETYGSLVRTHVVPAIGDVRLSDLTPLHVQRVITGVRRKGRADSTVRQVYSIVRKALADAQEWGLIANNPAERVERPKVAKKRVTYFSAEEARALVAAAAPTRWRYFVVLALTTGLRRGELLGLEWSDIDLDAGRLTTRRTLVRAEGRLQVPDSTKGDEDRDVPLSATAVSALRAQKAFVAEQRLAAGTVWEDRKGRLVFPTETGRWTDPRSATLGVTAIARKAGVKESRALHGLRHTGAALMVKDGVPLPVVKEILGHKDISTTVEHYGHIEDSQTQDAARRLSDRLGL